MIIFLHGDLRPRRLLHLRRCLQLRQQIPRFATCLTPSDTVNAPSINNFNVFTVSNKFTSSEAAIEIQLKSWIRDREHYFLAWFAKSIKLYLYFPAYFFFKLFGAFENLFQDHGGYKDTCPSLDDGLNKGP
ncbi:DNA-damage-repair/toleration protein [Sesbania bispinosa]|nr:DNA-damage-repair/toleration protein [Sesbania bispinosa]